MTWSSDHISVPLRPLTNMELSCTPCITSDPSLSLPEEHQKSHSVARSLSCSESEKYFSNSRIIKMSFSRSVNLKRHQRIRTAKQIKLLPVQTVVRLSYTVVTLRHTRGAIKAISCLTAPSAV